MTRFGFRWYGPEDEITLAQIRQIPPVTEVVASMYHIPAGELWPEADIEDYAGRAASAGLRFSVAEGMPVHESIKLGLSQRDRYIEQFAENLRRLARHGIQTVCYNFMPMFGWLRTELEWPLEDGSTTLGFRQETLDDWDPLHSVKKLPGWNFSTKPEEIGGMLEQYRTLGREGLWKNLCYFLEAVVPEADRLGIRLAIHPDDPPLPVLGLPRVVSTLEDIQRLTRVVDLPANGITLCTGSLGVRRENDVAQIADQLCAEGKIPFVHGRNVRFCGSVDFYESGHYTAQGSLNMSAIFAALKKRGFDGVIRSDHGRMVWGENGRPGYGLYDRAMGVCYLSGLWEAISYTS